MTGTLEVFAFLFSYSMLRLGVPMAMLLLLGNRLNSNAPTTRK